MEINFYDYLLSNPIDEECFYANIYSICKNSIELTDEILKQGFKLKTYSDNIAWNVYIAKILNEFNKTTNTSFTKGALYRKINTLSSFIYKNTNNIDINIKMCNMVLQQRKNLNTILVNYENDNNLNKIQNLCRTLLICYPIEILSYSKFFNFNNIIDATTAISCGNLHSNDIIPSNLFYGLTYLLSRKDIISPDKVFGNLNIALKYNENNHYNLMSNLIGSIDILNDLINYEEKVLYINKPGTLKNVLENNLFK